MNFEDFQSEEPKKNEIAPWKQIEDLKQQCQDLKKQLEAYQSNEEIIRSDNENDLTISEFIANLKGKKKTNTMIFKCNQHRYFQK